jgi:hypothetical protein
MATTRKPWKALNEQDYRLAASQGVHHSAKLTNSNAPAAGVRLARERRLDLPYVAVSTVAQSRLDYLKNTGSTATVWAQINRAAAGDAAEAAPAELAAIETALGDTDSPYEVGTDAVHKRLRQIVLQDAEGADFALSPLNSAGLSAVVDERLRSERQAAEQAWADQAKNPRLKPLQRRRAFLGLGGANPQNVGGLVRHTQRPLFFSAPREDRELRAALALYHRGYSVLPSRPRVQAYAEWRAALILRHGGVMPSDAVARDHEAAFLADYGRLLVSRADDAATRIRRHVIEDGEPLFADSVPKDVAALADADARYPGWARDLASRMVRVLLATPVHFEGYRGPLQVDADRARRWLGVLEEALS